MSEENSNYEEYAQSMYERALESMPEDIGVGDKEYIAITMKQFIQMSAEAMQKQYPDYNSDTIIFASHAVAEWTYQKGIDIIRAGIPKEYRDGLLQKVAFIAYETLDKNIKKGTPQELMLERVEKDVNKNFYESMNELCLKKCITEDDAKKAMGTSKILDYVKNTNTKTEQTEYEADDEVFDFMREDLEEQFANNDENAAEIQEKIQMQEYQRNYWTNQIENEPDNPEGYFNMSEVERQNNSKKALEYINKAIELDSNNSDFYMQRALIYKEIGNTSTYDTSSMEEFLELSRIPYEKEIADLTKVLALNFAPKETVLYERALAKLAIYEEQDAIEDFKALIDINSNFVEPYYELAKIERSNAKYIEAIGYFDKAIEIMPDNADLYYERGQAKEWSGNIEGAKEDYKKGLEINPEHEYLEYALNGIKIINQRDEEFNKQYNKITQYIIENPNDAEAYYNRGYLQICHEVEDEIILSDFDKAIELNPNYAEAYQQRIYIFEHMGEYEKLKKDYEKLIELAPTIENYDMYTRYLNSYFENGSQIALEVCNKMFEMFPASDTLYQLRGAAYYNLKNYDMAIADYKKAIELNPKNDTWQRILKQIEQEKNDSI